MVATIMAMLMATMKAIVPRVMLRRFGKRRRYNRQIDVLIRPVMRVYIM